MRRFHSNGGFQFREETPPPYATDYQQLRLQLEEAIDIMVRNGCSDAAEKSRESLAHIIALEAAAEELFFVWEAADKVLEHEWRGDKIASAVQQWRATAAAADTKG